MSVYDDNLAIRQAGKDAWIDLGSSRKLQIILGPSNRKNGIYIPYGILGSDWHALNECGQTIRDYLRVYLEPQGLPCGVEFLVGSAVHEPAFAAPPTPQPPQNPPPPPDIIPIHPPTTPPSPNDNIYYV